jgi:hypothetical protein
VTSSGLCQGHHQAPFYKNMIIKILHAIKEGRPSLYNMFKNIYRFVYVLHRIDKRGKTNKI